MHQPHLQPFCVCACSWGSGAPPTSTAPSSSRSSWGSWAGSKRASRLLGRALDRPTWPWGRKSSGSCSKACWESLSAPSCAEWTSIIGGWGLASHRRLIKSFPLTSTHADQSASMTDRVGRHCFSTRRCHFPEHCFNKCFNYPKKGFLKMFWRIWNKNNSSRGLGGVILHFLPWCTAYKRLCFLIESTSHKLSTNEGCFS